MAEYRNETQTRGMAPRATGAGRFVLRLTNTLGVIACIVCTLMLLVLSGCRSRETWRETVGNDTSQLDSIRQRYERPVAEVHSVAWSREPTTLRERDALEQLTYRDMTLDEVLHIAMQNSDVLRKLGGSVLRNPETMQSRFTQGLAATDPRFSPEAALSAFDAQLRASSFFSNNDQLYNNPFFGGGTNAFKQDLHEYNIELSKVTATGSQLSMRSVSIHNANNAPGNIFPNAWDTYLEGEIRKPLLQGAGIQFNQIAGPGSTPGVYNGVMIAKVNASVSHSDFEMAVRDYVNDVTNAYWDLYFAYRDLDSRTNAMQRALEAWNRIKVLQESDLVTGAAEALAREQYYRFKSEVDEAITGRVSQGTRSGSGSSGGSLEGSGGVQTTERRLRLLTGMTITDGELIRPSDEPVEADMIFDWGIAQEDAFKFRPELRRQQLVVRRREMEMLAARNYLNPRLDAVGRYRFRGFGNDLLRTQEDVGNVSSAVGNLLDGDQQEWFVGFEYTVPLGYRQAHLAVRNAELMLHRERIVQREQQRQVVHDLSNAITDASRAYEACRNSLNRYLAARELLSAYEVQEENALDVDVDHLLDAQRRVVEAEIRYYRARTEYAIALKNVHLEKGSLLSYHNLHIFDRPTANVKQSVAQASDEESGTVGDDVEAVQLIPPTESIEEVQNKVRPVSRAMLADDEPHGI